MAKGSALRPLLATLTLVLAGAWIALFRIAGDPGRALKLFALFLGLLAGGLLVYTASILFAIALHEFGHYAAGRAVGFRLQSLVAGPFGFRREGRRMIRFAVRPVRLMGFVTMAPPDDRAFLARFGVFILGGPVASVLWAILTAALVVRTGSGGGSIIAGVERIVGYAVLIGAIAVLPGTLIPFRARRMGGFPTDALWLVILARGGGEARRLVALMTLTRLALAGTPARELPEPLVDEAVRLRDGTIAEAQAQAIRWASANARDPALGRAAMARHAEIAVAHGERLVEPWLGWARILQATYCAFDLRDADACAVWLDGVADPNDPTLAAGLSVAKAGLAALRDDPDRWDRLETAERAVDLAAEKTTVSWTQDRERLAALREGWSSRSSGPV